MHFATCDVVCSWSHFCIHKGIILIKKKTLWCFLLCYLVLVISRKIIRLWRGILEAYSDTNTWDHNGDVHVTRRHVEHDPDIFRTRRTRGPLLVPHMRTRTQSVGSVGFSFLRRLTPNQRCWFPPRRWAASRTAWCMKGTAADPDGWNRCAPWERTETSGSKLNLNDRFWCQI